MDALLHMVGKASPEVDVKLAWYEKQLREVMAVAREHYHEVRLFVCSDHGMATVHTVLDIKKPIEALGLRFGEDYVGTYDSTLARFWFFNEEARARVTEVLGSIKEVRVLPQDELESLGCDFEGHQYGELVFLTNPGVIIVPSDMGLTPITGMHGYHPDDPDSDASLLGNAPLPDDATAIPHVFNLMCSETGIVCPPRTNFADETAAR
jgi:hypothetical protein